LIECLTHSRGLERQVRVIGLNVGGDGRAISVYPYRGGASVRSLDLTPQVDPADLAFEGSMAGQRGMTPDKWRSTLVKVALRYLDRSVAPPLRLKNRNEALT
jgi:hypothetical protein